MRMNDAGREAIRSTVRRFGVELKRFPQCDPLFQGIALLDRNNVDVVLDVGANRGQYANDLRRFGYTGRIISFEPVMACFDRLLAASANDHNWAAHRIALGSTSGISTINVAANNGASSSFLPMLESHVNAAPEAQYVRQETVNVSTVDEFVAEHVNPDARVFLKLDVQGFEKAVIQGAQHTLPSLAGVQIEMSFVPLYDGGMLYLEVFDWAASQGFTLMSIEPMFTDPRTGQLLQADGIFIRDPCSLEG
jgi:FkbM family methyltransferase